MPFTVLKGYSTQTAASNSGVWGAGNAGNDLNTGVMGIMDINMAGVYSASLSSSNVSLSATDVQNCILRFTGTLTGNIVVSPAGGVTTFNGFYYWENLTSGNFTVTISSNGTVALPQSRRGVLFVDSVNGPRIMAVVGSANAQVFPSGTVSPFYQNAAPTGWTIVSSLNDYGLRIVSSAGGVTAGTNPYSTFNAQTATGNHTLSSNELPSHQHFIANTTVVVQSGDPTLTPTNYLCYGNADGSGDQASYDLKGSATVATVGLSSATGGGAAHTHPITAQILTADFILATLN